MSSYATLLEKTRVPQPSIQSFAVISVFSKLRSAPQPLGSESEAGREAISFCLTSESLTIVDQSVREICQLVSDSVLDLSRGLLELQSALEGCHTKLVSLFVKGLGFLIRIGYEQKDENWKFSSTENHPFVRQEVTEVHLLGVQLVDGVLFLCASPHVHTTEQESVIESLKHLLAVQKDLGLPYARDLSLVVLSLVFMLAKSNVEHEELSILKFLLFLLKWKT